MLNTPELCKKEAARQARLFHEGSKFAAGLGVTSAKQLPIPLHTTS
jgi:hypothetical protein